MKTKTLAATAVLCATALVLSGCKPIEGDGNRSSTAFADLKDEKQKVSYVIGTQVGESLAPAKDEIDLDVLVGAMKDAIDGKPSTVDEAQAMQVMQAFSERMQAVQMAKLEEDKQKNAAEGEAFLAGNAKKDGVQTTASGLQYEVLEAGDGPRPSATDTVRVHYKGTLLDGETFDSSYDRNEPVQFALNQVVPGWQEGLQLMPVGSKYRLWVPGALGYGEMGTPGGPIGPNATLVFEVELLEIVNAAQ
ncbi:FKBP-type peptidyl-prolyl cis-trans isomerase [Luteimonas aestuarii]|nr:FKBP-type peptidyl-prolyl cis-trans isomerase [Luteimonas aestuarii]